MNKDNAKDYLPLVRALVDGRQIQHQKTDGTWIDEIEFSFDWPAHRYRIKPEPREFWVNELPNVGAVVFESERQAIEHANQYGLGHVTRRCREVLE